MLPKTTLLNVKTDENKSVFSRNTIVTISVSKATHNFPTILLLIPPFPELVKLLI